MPDRTLTILVFAAVALSAAHDADHLIRDDFSQPNMLAILGVFLSVKYALTAAAVYFYLRGRLGAAFWAVIGVLGAAAVWFAHLSPASDQKASDIYAMYASPAAGFLASGVVYAMMAAFLALAVYGGWRATAGRRAAA